MESFIREIVKKYVREMKDGVDRGVLIFPNKRAGLFFKRALMEEVDYPILCPQIYSLEEFIEHIYHLTIPDTLFLVSDLYRIYKQLYPKAENLEKFFFWGEIILRDFEDIDLFLVHADKIFEGVRSQKELDEKYFFLEEREQAIIQSFWKNFLPAPRDSQKEFLDIWNILFPLYREFKTELRAKSVGYKGMIYREIVDLIKKKEFSVDTETYWFVGFHALSKAEEYICKYFITEHNARFFWDADSFYVENENYEAGFFFRKYQKDAVLSKTLPDTFPTNFTKHKYIEEIGVSLEMGQIKLLHQMLKELCLPPLHPNDTVIIVCSEYFLFPLLHTIPENLIEGVNITLGYPLKESTFYSLILALFDLKINEAEKPFYYYKFVLPILKHPSLLLLETDAQTMVDSIEKENKIYIYKEEFENKGDLLRSIFCEDIDIMLIIKKTLQILYEKTHDEGFEKVFVYQIYKVIEGLENILYLLNATDRANTELLKSLFKKTVEYQTIPFTGDPLEGLQIMNLLETRNLDFKNVIFIGANEGNIPPSYPSDSFIPYNIRRAFGIPTFQHYDALYAYLFYRVIQRSENVFFLYNNISEHNINGEKSRFLMQLYYESSHTIHQKILTHSLKAMPINPIIIEKTAPVQKQLSLFCVKQKEEKPPLQFSPSSLNVYLECRLKFYFQHIAKIPEPKKVEEELTPAFFGNILHLAIECLYKDFMEKKNKRRIEKEDFGILRESVRDSIIKAFQEHYKFVDSYKYFSVGNNLIAEKVISQTIHQILKYDESTAPFEIIALEMQDLGITIPVLFSGKEEKVMVSGKIDRVDKKENTIRILDYKTGKDKQDFESISSLFERDNKKRNKAAMQTFLYGLFFLEKYPSENSPIQIGIFNIKELFSHTFSPTFFMGGSKTEIKDIRPYMEEYFQNLSLLIQEILDETVPFNQTDDLAICKNCIYKNICRR